MKSTQEEVIASTSEQKDIKSGQPISNGHLNNANNKNSTPASTDYASTASSKSDFEDMESLEDDEDYKCGYGG